MSSNLKPVLNLTLPQGLENNLIRKLDKASEQSRPAWKRRGRNLGPSSTRSRPSKTRKSSKQMPTPSSRRPSDDRARAGEQPRQLRLLHKLAPLKRAEDSDRPAFPGHMSTTGPPKHGGPLRSAPGMREILATILSVLLTTEARALRLLESMGELHHLSCRRHGMYCGLHARQPPRGRLRRGSRHRSSLYTRRAPTRTT